MSTRFQRLPVILVGVVECSTWDVRSGVVRSFRRRARGSDHPALTKDGDVVIGTPSEVAVYHTDSLGEKVRSLPGCECCVLSSGKIATLSADGILRVDGEKIAEDVCDLVDEILPGIMSVEVRAGGIDGTSRLLIREDGTRVPGDYSQAVPAYRSLGTFQGEALLITEDRDGITEILYHDSPSGTTRGGDYWLEGNGLADSIPVHRTYYPIHSHLRFPLLRYGCVGRRRCQ